MNRNRVANGLALAAIILWGSLAWLGVRLSSMPPFLLVGTALTIAGVLASPTWRRWRVGTRVLALGVYGLFGFHFFLFVALRLAPPLQANLVNYLWPLLMVLMAPLFLRGVRLTRAHLSGATLGLCGAMLAVTNGRWPGDGPAASGDAPWGYAAALLSAFVWASYSLLGQRMRLAGSAFPIPAVGLFCLVSGVLALACHALLEAPYAYAGSDVLPLLALAIGPMGAAFFLWDGALRLGDARAVGTLAYLTPLISTTLLGLDDPSRFGWPIAVALALVLGGALLGTRSAPAGESAAAIVRSGAGR